MKKAKLIVIVSLLLVAGLVQAQQISIRKEVVYAGNTPYGLIQKSGSSWARDFSFRNLKGEEIFTAKPVLHELGGGQDYVYYQISIKGFPQKAEMEDRENLARILAIEAYNNEVLIKDALNKAGAENLLAKFPPIISARLQEQENAVRLAGESFASQAPVAGSPAPEQAILVPGKKADSKTSATVVASGMLVPANSIYINGNSLFKDNQKVGQFKVIDQEEDGKKERIYSIFNLQNRIVAVINFPAPESTSCTITTFADAKSQQLDLKNDNRAIKALAEWLVQHNYL